MKPFNGFIAQSEVASLGFLIAMLRRDFPSPSPLLKSMKNVDLKPISSYNVLNEVLCRLANKRLALLFKCAWLAKARLKMKNRKPCKKHG
jgi:hypothetical protein